MGGGDLDGDLYFVCWDGRLSGGVCMDLEENPRFQPMDYDIKPSAEQEAAQPKSEKVGFYF